MSIPPHYQKTYTYLHNIINHLATITTPESVYHSSDKSWGFGTPKKVIGSIYCIYSEYRIPLQISEQYSTAQCLTQVGDVSILQNVKIF